MRNMLRILMLLVLLTGARSAFADATCGPNRELRQYPQYSDKGVLSGQGMGCSPVRCSPGNEDSTCITPIVTAWQTPTNCSTGPGWTTTTPAKWIGSQYTAPTCNYQAPPSCPGGYTEISPPSWNGATWVGLACVPSLPPPPDPVAICQNTVPSGFSITSQDSTTPANLASWGKKFPGGTLLIFGAVGPSYTSECHGGQDLYILGCSVSPAGGLNGWNPTPAVNDGNCGH